MGVGSVGGSTRSTMWWLVAMIAVLGSLVPSAMGVPGVYKSLGVLKNKWLYDPDLVVDEFEGTIVGDDVSFCENSCIKHKLCTGFAYSKSYSRCILYQIKPGTPPVQNSGYDIYIKMYSEAEGYYQYDTGYIRLMYERLPAVEARQNCSDQGGSLVAVRTKKLNDLLYNLLVTNNMWHAYIGLTDEEQEGVWKWPDGGKLGGKLGDQNWVTRVDGRNIEIEKWEWNGVWGRRDRNCAVIINGFEAAPWKQFNCKRADYYFCQIPMF